MLKTREHCEDANEIKRVLDKLGSLCRTPAVAVVGAAQPGGAMYAPRPHVQTMLRHLGAVDVLLEALELAEPLRTRKGRESIQLVNLQSICARVCGLLCWLAYKNKETQTILFPDVVESGLFLRLMRLRIGACSVITEVLRNRKDLILLLPPDFVAQVIRHAMDVIRSRRSH